MPKKVIFLLRQLELNTLLINQGDGPSHTSLN